MLARRQVLGIIGLGSLAACGTSPLPAQTDTTTTETGAEPVPDTPSEPVPECPGSFGELVECECGFVDACTIESADGTDCTLACPELASCDTVICEFDIAHGWPACVAVTNPEALDCTFAALLSGAEAQVALWLTNTYPFSWYDDHRGFTRLGPERWLRTRDYSEGNDVGQSSKSWSAGIYALSDAMIVECMAAGSPEEAFDCLFAAGDVATSCEQLPTCAP